MKNQKSLPLCFLLLLGASAYGNMFWSTIPENVEREHVIVRSLSSRSIEGEKSLQFQAFGNDFHLILKPADDIFPKDFQMFTSDRDDNGNVRLTRIKSEDYTDSGSLYSIQNHPGSLYITPDDLVHGVINHELRIVPAEDKVSHVVFKIQNEKKTFNADSTNNIHASASVKSAGGKPFFSTAEERVGQVPDEVHAELLVVIDPNNTHNFEQIRYGMAEFKNYVGIFWNSVQKGYDLFTNPRVKLHVSKLIFIEHLKDLYPEGISSPVIQTEDVTNAFKNWYEKASAGNAVIKSVDFAVLHMGLDAATYSREQGWSLTISGCATIGGMCDKNGQNVGYIEDTSPYFSGIRTAVHELGHSFNMQHDGDEPSDRCSPEDGYIMNPGKFDSANMWTWSQCSHNVLGEFVRSDKGNCTWNVPGVTEVTLEDVLPGRIVWDRDVQCQKTAPDRHTAHAEWYEPNKYSCVWLKCVDPADGSFKSITPYDGTTCGMGKICMRGKCVADDVPTLEEQCIKRMGSGAISINTQLDTTLCQKLRCVPKDGKQWFDTNKAEEYTSCGRAGVCIDGSCRGEALSYAEQCARVGFPGRVAPADLKGDELCTTELRCSFPTELQYQGFSGNYPDDYTDCDPGKVCIHQKCVAL